uniref:Genome polyprotein n=1 Tax=Rousettus madagascariensis teschovirus TaxID=3044260 RepID=A0AA49FRI5_9PICO|nr:MAG: polyprotein [Rousettus madagascariensis teschovirus]
MEKFIRFFCNFKKTKKQRWVVHDHDNGSCPIEKVALISYDVEATKHETEKEITHVHLDCANAFHKQGVGSSKLESGNNNNSGNSGTINYNFYANSYTDSIDLSGALSNSTSENGSGQGTYQNSTHRQENSFLGLLSSGLNAVSTVAPLLADPKTEEYEVSDRVQVDQSGTSTLITQATVGTSGYRGSSKLSKTTSAAADQPTTIGPAGDRYITITAQPWTTSQKVYSWQAAHLPVAVLLAQPSPFRSMAARHHLMRCGWSVQVQINSTRFHGGALGIFMIPEFAPSFKNGIVTAGQAEWQRFAAWNEPQDMRDLSKYSYGKQTTQVYQWARVRTTDTGLTPESLFLFPHQILNPRTNSSVSLEVPYVGCVPSIDPSIYNPWSIVVVVLRRLQYADGATPTLTVTCSVRPTDLSFHGLREPLSYTEGPAPPVQITASQQMWTNTQPEVGKPVYPHIYAPATDYLPGSVTDYMQIARVPCLTKQRRVTVLQTKPSAAIFKCPIKPLCDQLRPTALGTTTALFTQWRGSITFRVVFTGNQMQNVRVVMCYTPPDWKNEEPTTMEEAMMGHYVVFDTGIDSAAILNVPYISMADFTPVAQDTRDLNNVESPLFQHGWFTIWQYTDLAVPPGAPPTAEFLVFAYAGQDYSVKGPGTLSLGVQSPDDASPLQPGEDGATNASSVQDSNEQPHPIPHLPTKASSFDTFWNRYFYLTGANMESTSRTYTVNLDPMTLFYNDTIRSALHATYVRCDLDFALKVIWVQNNISDAMAGEIFITYAPPGAVVPTFGEMSDTVDSANNYNNSYFSGHGALPFTVIDTALTNMATFSVPYTAISSAVPTVYSGVMSSQTNGSFPDLNFIPTSYGFGKLVIRPDRILANRPIRIVVFMRFRNMKVWCPRPAIPSTFSNKTTDDTPSNTARTEAPSHFTARMVQQAPKDSISNKQLLKQCGDIEENPGPAIFTALKMLQDPLFTQFCNQYDSLREKYQDIASAIEAFTNQEQENAFMKKAFKLVGAGLLAYRAAKDPMTAAAVAFMFGSDFFAWLVNKIIKWVGGNSATPPPPFARPRQKDAKACCCGGACEGKNPFCDEPTKEEKKANLLEKMKNRFNKQGKLQDANALINLCKGADWIASQIKRLYEWLAAWKKQEEENSPDNFQKLMAQYPQMFLKYRQCRNNYRHPDRQAVTEYFSKLRELASKHQPRLINLFPVLDSVPLDPTRPEPVVLLLKGKPGQGKSVAAEILAKMLSQSVTGKRDYFAFNSSLNHFDGYQQQTVMVLDDLGQNPDGLDFKMFCQLVSTTTCVLPMADLADKGREFKSEVVICTTNLPALNPVTIADPKALERRIFIECVVEAGHQFQKPDGTLDLGKAIQPTGGPSPDPLLDTDRHLYHPEALRFVMNKKQKITHHSLLDIFKMLRDEVRERQDIACNLDQIFSKQAPTKDFDHQLEKLIQNWKTKHGDNPGSDNMLACKVIELCHGCDVLREYTQFCANWTKNRRQQYEECIKTMSLIMATLTVILSFLGVCYTLYTIMKESDTHNQGPYGGNAPKPKPRARQSLLELVELQAPGKKMETSMEQAVAAKNLLLVPVIRTNGKDDKYHILAVGGTKFLTNYHQWTEIKSLLIQEKWFHKDTIRAVLGVFDGEESDVVCFDLPGVQPYRSIVKSFYDGYYPRGAIVKGIDLQSGVPMLWIGDAIGKKKNLDTWEGPIPKVLTYKAHTGSGFCGSPVFVDVGSSKKICGIHCAGTGTIGSAAEVTQQMLVTMIETLEAPAKQGKIYDVYRVPFVYTPTKTTLEPTITCVNPQYMPAALSPFDERLVNPFQFKKTILSKHVGDSNNVPYAIIQAAREYAALVKTFNPDITKRITVRQAIEGMENLDGMDFSKSPGYPYVLHGMKRRHLVDDNMNLIGIAKAEFEKYNQNDYSEHIFTTFLKDELRPAPKVYAGKTRVIDIASFPHAVMGRVIFGNLFSTFHRYPGWVLGSAVGCDPDTDWTRFMLTAPGAYTLAMDYSGFDATHSSGMFAVLKLFLTELGFGMDAGYYVDSLCDSRHIWDDEHYRMKGGMPSGCAGTTIFNTIFNNIVARAALKYCGATENSAVLCYGDDILVSAEEPFNIQDWKDFYGLTPYKITSADKNDDIVWQPLEKCTFLKRSFVYDHGVVRPAMDPEHIRQMLMWARSGTIQEKLCSLARIAVHSGRHAYNVLFSPFAEIGFYIPPFDNLDEDFLHSVRG